MATKEKIESFRTLASILATLSSGLFMAAGIFGSLTVFSMSQPFEMMQLNVDATQLAAKVNTTAELNQTLITESAQSFVEAGQTSFLMLRLFLLSGTLLAFGALISWQYSHNLLKSIEE